MIGHIVRCEPRNGCNPTPAEKRLSRLRDTLEYWSELRLGLKHPATSRQRLEMGHKIYEVKRDLLEAGIYRRVPVG